jgi:tetratricopeptide (TPR) repeat protein
MSGFQIILLLISLYFFWEVYKLIVGRDFENMTKERKQNEDPLVKLPEIKKDVDTLLQKANRAIEYEDFDGAISYLEEASEIEPTNSEIFAKIGFAYERKNYLDDALKNYLHAIKLDPNDDRFHLAIASLYRKMQKPHEAQNHYEKALLIDPNYPITYFNYGNLLLDMGKKDEAKNMYKKALELDGSFDEAKKALKDL